MGWQDLGKLIGTIRSADGGHFHLERAGALLVSDSSEDITGGSHFNSWLDVATRNFGPTAWRQVEARWDTGST